MTNQDFSGFCQIVSFNGSEWATLSPVQPNSMITTWKFLDCAKFHPLHVQSGRILNFGLDFDCNWKFHVFYHISSFAFHEWSKMFVFSQIFNTTQNFLIVQDFVLYWSLINQKCQFLRQLFNATQNVTGFCQALSNIFLLSQISNIAKARLKISGFCLMSSAGMSLNGPTTIESWAWFLLRMKVYEFYQLSSFAFAEWLRNVSLEVNLWQHSKITSLAGQGWSNYVAVKIKFTTRKNKIWTLPNSILRKSGLVKNRIFEPDFQCNWVFLDFAKFLPLHVKIGQNHQ